MLDGRLTIQYNLTYSIKTNPEEFSRLNAGTSEREQFWKKVKVNLKYEAQFFVYKVVGIYKNIFGKFKSSSPSMLDARLWSLDEGE